VRGERFFFGLTEIGTYYAGLQAGLEELGYDAVLVNLVPHRFGRARWRGSIPWVVRVAARLAEVRNSAPDASRLPNIAWRYVNAFGRLVLLLWAVFRFDVFVFSYGSTFFGYRELPLLHRFGKRIVYVFHGTDHRPAYLDGSEMAPERGVSIEECIAVTAAKKARITRIERHATIIIGNRLSSQLHERPVVHFGAVGVPQTAADTKPAADDGVVRILHSPSHPAAKGSAEIRTAVAAVSRLHTNVVYTELTDVPHGAVLRALAETDIVIDQLYSDVGMASFAHEAAAHGCTVIVGSYGVEEIRKTPTADLPVVLCHPEALTETLSRLVTDPDERVRRSNVGRRFILDHCSPATVASRFIGALRDPEPVAFDPAQIRYCYGVGLSQTRVRSIIRSVLALGGRDALCVRDKPGLEQAVADFALSEEPRL
jgi:hypothetical protein